MKATLKFAMLLGAVVLVSGQAQVAYAVVPAAWAEEMYNLPGAQWGFHDDFQDPAFKNALVQIDQAGDGVWKHPETSHPNGGSQGMALVVTNDNPLDAVPSMAGPGLAQYTAEFKFKIVSELDPFGGLGNDSLWWNVGGGAGSGNSGPDVRMFEGRYDNGNGDVFYMGRSGEGFLGSEPNGGNFEGDAGIFLGTSRGDWHLFRMIQDEVAGTQRIYIDGVLQNTYDILGYNRAVGFTRSTAFGFYNHPDGSVPYAEVHYDYFRIANGVVEPGTAVTSHSCHIPRSCTALR